MICWFLMTSNDFNIDKFALRVRQLIENAKKLEADNAELVVAIKSKDEEINRLKKIISEQEGKYNTLMTARMLDITDVNIDDVKKRVNGLIRTVNQCVTLLSEKQDN